MQGAVVLLAVLLAPPALCAAAEPASDALRHQAGDLTYTNELLKVRAALADADAFYLVLDQGSMKLQLMLKGALLRTYDVAGARLGVPRVAFVSSGAPARWQARIWYKGTLDPPRERERTEIKVQPAPAKQDAARGAPEPPPTPEELYPVPDRYHLRFQGGFSLEVYPGEGNSSASFLGSAVSGSRSALRDFAAAVSGDPDDLIRLRLQLQPADAASLYRALPPDVSLLVVPAPQSAP